MTSLIGRKAEHRFNTNPVGEVVAVAANKYGFRVLILDAAGELTEVCAEDVRIMETK